MSSDFLNILKQLSIFHVGKFCDFFHYRILSIHPSIPQNKILLFQFFLYFQTYYKVSIQKNPWDDLFFFGKVINYFITTPGT